jgi:hypothetical protein
MFFVGEKVKKLCAVIKIQTLLCPKMKLRKQATTKQKQLSYGNKLADKANT